MPGLADKTVLITGGAGFLGRALAAVLSAVAARVVVADREQPAAGSEFLHCDLTDAEQVRACIARTRPAMVYHLAGLVDGREDLSLLRPAFESNVVGTFNLFEAVREGDLPPERIIMTGSIEETAYGTAPGSPYAVSKAAAALYASYFARCVRLPLVRVVLANVYGPGQARAKLIPHTILSCLAGRPPELRSPSRACDLVYLDDAVRGLVRAAEEKVLEGRTVSIRGGRSLTVAAVASLIAAQIEGRAATLDAEEPARPGAGWDWVPQTNLADGMARTIEWYRTHGSEL